MADSRSAQDVMQALGLARGYLRAGKVSLAEMVCQQVLAQSPDHPEALHLAALAHLTQGRHELAMELLDRAVARAPDSPELRNDQAECLRLMGRAEAALEACRAALDLRPEYPEARNNLGVVLGQLGRTDEAIEAFTAALAQRADYPEALFNLGVTLTDAARHGQALAPLLRFLELVPTNAVARERLAHALLALGREAEAIPHFAELTRLLPGNFDAWYALGGLEQRARNLPAALAALEKAVALKPEHPWARFHLGMVLEDMDRADDALAQFEASDRLSPDNPATLTRISVLLRGQRRLDEAEARVRRALELKPGDAHALNALGLVAFSRQRWSQASAAFMGAAGAREDLAMPLVNMASLYARRGDFVARRHYFELALARAPGNDQIRFSLALSQLLIGEWEAGWRNYAHRPNVTRIADYQHLLLAEPLPADLSGRRILIHHDQGLGDEILFLRFAPLLKARGAWLAYQPNPKLASFVGKLPFLDMAVNLKEEPDNLDYRIAVCDLALAVGMADAADIPPPVALTPSPGALGQARRLLAPLGAGPFIGVTWRGGTSKEEFSKWNVLYKEIDPDALAGLLRDVPGQVLILQRKPRAGEVARFAERLGRPVHDFSAVNEQLEVMLALLSLIDEYVAVSNTNVHIRGGVGRISRVLIPHPPDWRWMASGRSPWYPNVPTYREKLEGWEEALAALHADLTGNA